MSPGTTTTAISFAYMAAMQAELRSQTTGFFENLESTPTCWYMFDGLSMFIIIFYWLVVCFFFHLVGKFIIPTDEVIFFRGVGIPSTSHFRYWNGNFFWAQLSFHPKLVTSRYDRWWEETGSTRNTILKGKQGHIWDIVSINQHICTYIYTHIHIHII